MKLLKFFSILGLSIAAVGCSSAEAQRKKYVSAHPDLPENVRGAILAGDLLPGMTKEQVIATWGKPLDTATQEEGEGNVERWVWGYQQADMRNGLYYGTTQVRTGEAVFRDDQLVMFEKQNAPIAP